MNLQHCSCGQPVGDGRHFRKCLISNGPLKIHDSLRDLGIEMLRSAGLVVQREPMGLLPDALEDRPADALVRNWDPPISKFRDHAIDFTFPLVDSKFSHLSAQEQARRQSTCGVLAGNKTSEKLSNRLGIEAQNRRGNNLTMSERCARQHIHYWPAPVEGDGAESDQFTHLLKLAGSAAGELRGHDVAVFRRKWKTRFGCRLFKLSAKISLARGANEFRRFARAQEPRDPVLLPEHLEEPVHYRSFRNQFSSSRSAWIARMRRSRPGA